MSDLIRSAIVPIYLLLCIVLGGSTQGIYTNLALQLIGIGIIVWAVLTRAPGPLPRAGRPLFLLAIGVLLLFAIQLIPLPPNVWSVLPGRGGVADGYRLLGQPQPWLPLTLAPFDTLATALTLIPPLAVLSAMLLRGSFRPVLLTSSVLLGAFAAVLLGALQVGSSDPLTSPWYLYAHSNFGFATGFFANSNHMGALLLISIPLLIALVRNLRERAANARAGSAALMLVVAGVLVLGLGVVLNGSLAVLLLGLPTLAISATMLKTRGLAVRQWAFVAAAVSLGAVIALLLTPLGERMLGENTASLETREGIWTTTLRAIQDFMPLGTGIGTFREVYPMYEDPAQVTTTVVNHAHNDYLEIVLESGVPGFVLLLMFFLWWGPRALHMWRPSVADSFGQAAAIASGLLLVHSIVDYPLRMPALSAILAMCLSLMVLPSRSGQSEAEDLWPTRHFSV